MPKLLDCAALGLADAATPIGKVVQLSSNLLKFPMQNVFVVTLKLRQHSDRPFLVKIEERSLKNRCFLESKLQSIAPGAIKTFEEADDSMTLPV